ncbi:ferredoxin [Rhodococcoides kyotonense]|uniref:Ferredoxin n=1 Tax=Rhodococcoides kyotonense TaxID=398843 RepID=A0A239LZR2_9NOCA|nr:ferredoxin [Rhodococcus kyotonensis]SNT36097.1 ferredoxin [Rhodococcus kyotonensis]
MKIFVDQIECTGSGQCELIAPELFTILDSGLATVIDSTGAALDDGGEGVGADVPDAAVDAVRDAMDICPGACIHELGE